MPIEDRRGTCAQCSGPIYRHPYPGGAHPDRWVHRRSADWVDTPHEAVPAPADEEEQP